MDKKQLMRLLKRPKGIVGVVVVLIALLVSQEPWELLSDTGQQDDATSQVSQSTTSEGTQTAEDVSVVEGETYSSPEEVAAYIDAYDELPENYITKSEAESMGWESNQGNLWEVTDEMSIGGDHFGNYEELLPTDDEYREADVNYDGGYRGPERIIYSDDGDIYYTDDHYESFEQLY